MDFEKVAPGDLLLLDTDERLWKVDRRVLAGGLVAIRVVSRDGFDYTLARVGAGAGGDGLTILPYAGDDPPTAESPDDRPNYTLTNIDLRAGRAIELDEGKDAPPSPRPPASGPTDLGQTQESESPTRPPAAPPVGPDRPLAARTHFVDAVVALCVMLIRR